MIGEESYKTHERGMGHRKIGRQEDTFIQPTDSFRLKHQQREVLTVCIFMKMNKYVCGFLLIQNAVLYIMLHTVVRT